MALRRDQARLLDEYLVAAARAGDRAAFERLAVRWQKRMILHAWRLLGDGEAARDAVQDAWADIVRSLPTLQDVATFPAWSMRIVTRRCADGIRKAQRRRKTANALSVEPHNAVQSPAAIEAKADASPLKRAIDQLPRPQKVVIALFYTEDFSVAEIAAALSVPPGTVKSRLMSARRAMRTALENGAVGNRKLEKGE